MNSEHRAEWDQRVLKIMLEMSRPFSLIVLGGEDELAELLKKKGFKAEWKEKPHKHFDMYDGVVVEELLGETLAKIIEDVLDLDEAGKSGYEYVFMGDHNTIWLTHDGDIRSIA